MKSFNFMLYFHTRGIARATAKWTFTGLWSGGSALMVAASATAHVHSLKWLLSTAAAGATSENYLLASTKPTSYGFTWPTPSGQILGTDAGQFRNSNGPSIRVGEPNGEIEREAIWAKADVAESVKRVQFEREFIKFYLVMSSDRPSRDTLACVGYVSCSTPLYKYPRYTEYSVGWII